MPLLAAGTMAVGAWLISVAEGAADLPAVTVGLLLAVLSSVFMTLTALIHLCVAREVLFTRESIIVRQTGRRDVELPFIAYQHQWVADCSSPWGVRLMLFGRNRGCFVWSAPGWFREALREIARIQAEEGWYPPEKNEQAGH
ncbi:hypothetical protein HZA57_05495 [Candidatus Poribacteria bacterium]|nr:hypothetical protein [Candidatus Poribacteria bacterium]